jgi:hypothetical protein
MRNSEHGELKGLALVVATADGQAADQEHERSGGEAADAGGAAGRGRQNGAREPALAAGAKHNAGLLLLRVVCSASHLAVV